MGSRRNASPASSARDDLQTLLFSALDDRAKRLGWDHACFWLPASDAAPLVIAGLLAGGAAATSREDGTALDAAWKQNSAFDLGAAGIDGALRNLSERHGFGAAAPLRTRAGEAVAMLWLGGEAARPGRVGRETLEEMDALVASLAPAASLWHASERFAHLDESLQRLDRLASLGDLVAEVVHEIRNPLVSVKTFLQLLPGREDDPEFTGDFREVVLDEMARLERLLEAVARHARPPSSANDTGGDVADAVETVAALLKHRALDRELNLGFDLEGSLPRVALAEDALRQVVLNLSLNAIEASPAGTEIRIRARPCEGGVEIEVEDQGPGVPAELRATIFEPFVSSRSQRVGGLGLAITQRLLDEVGATIRCEVGRSGGARFVASVPARASSSR